MGDFKTRGYSMLGTLKYIDSVIGAEGKERIVAQLSPDVRDALSSYKEIGWYPSHHFSELLRGIVKEGESTNQVAEEALVKTGQFVAGLAVNTFLRLLMKVLTPSLFAKKIPSLWERDNQGGLIEADLKDADSGKIVFNLRDVGGYDYIVPVAGGWISFAMQAMGKTVLERKISGWTLEQPGPANARIDLRWQT